MLRKKDVEVVFESVRPVTAEVDEVKMTLVMSNLGHNIFQELLIQFRRHLLLHQQGIRQHLHGSQRSLQLMGYIGNKISWIPWIF